MAAAELTSRRPRVERIARWRAEELERAGYEASGRLAARSSRATSISTTRWTCLRNGCDPSSHFRSCSSARSV